MIEKDWLADRQRAQHLGIEWVASLDDRIIDWYGIEILPYRFARQSAILPLMLRSDGRLDTLIADPLDLESIDMARFLLKRPLNLLIAPQHLLLKWLEHAYEKWKKERPRLSDREPAKSANQTHGVQKNARSDQFTAPNLADRKDLSLATEQFDQLFCRAVAQRASDIHFEPGNGKWQVRYRIDGVMHAREELPDRLQRNISTRIKALAGLDISENRRPQDGRLRIDSTGCCIDVRISTIPSEGGERLALRLLDQSDKELKLSSLHLPREIESALRAQLELSQGLLIVCGPTGSGKTTTLYSALGEMQCDRENIMTIEDPIEYRLKGISQMAVSPKIGLDFANGLRHLLRQDPDVLLLGEMRDAASAQIAYRAALTGHLVLSTLHATSAKGALMRLLELGVEPHLLFSCLNGILYQRLVRMLCPHCKQSVTKDRATHRRLRGTCSAVGCEKCHQTGYFGRRAVFEWLPIDRRSTGPSAWKNMPNCPTLIAQSDQLTTGLIPLHQHALQLLDERVSSQKELQKLL